MKYKGVQIDKLSIFSTPGTYLELTLLLLKDSIVWLKNFIITKGILIFVVIVTWLVISNVEALQTVEDIIYFTAYWVILGIASSIGLGTGLHTFVLYLGPHIAKVAIAATHCGYLPDMIPSRWTFDHFADCQTNPDPSIGIFGILLAVQIQSFLWGLGTAIGQLPPYFIAKKASETRAELRRITNKAQGHAKVIDEEEEKIIKHEKDQHHIGNDLTNEEIQQVLQLKRKQNPTLMDRAKIIIFDNMEKYGFWTILACASIPNPLFDLAGITCGHFLIPFRTFFSATFIGKAIIKVHIQMVFVIAIFRKQSLEWIINLIKSLSESIAEKAASSFEQQKKILYEPSRFSENKPFIAKIWDIFIIFMIVYFVKSIVDAQVQEKAIELVSEKDKK